MTIDYKDLKIEFLKSVKDNKMKIIYNNGLNRNIKFENINNLGNFEIITWIKHLCITGDFGTYVFSRVPDMFEFFSLSQSMDFSINPSYWGEKLLSICRNNGYKEFDEEVFKSCVKEDFDNWEFENLEARYVVWEEIEMEVLTYSDNEHDAIESINNFTSGYEHQFIDFLEHDLTSFTHNYLWCLHCIVWGIKEYNNLKV